VPVDGIDGGQRTAMGGVSSWVFRAGMAGPAAADVGCGGGRARICDGQDPASHALGPARG